MIVELGKKLDEKGLFPETTVSAADETSIEHMITSVKSYSDEALGYLSQINTHSYGGWNFREELHELAREMDKKLWQSESGPLGKNDNSDIAMWMSDVIIRDLRKMQPAVWIDWQVCDPHPDWRSIEIDNGRQRFTYNKRYYMHAAFSRFIRPGAQFIFSSDENSVAALVPTNGNLVIVLRNASPQSTDYTIDLSQCESLADIAQIHRFELPGSLSRKDDIPVINKELALTTPGQTITTCVIPDVVPTPVIRNRKPVNSGIFRCILTNNTLSFPVVPSKTCELHIYNSVGRRIYSGALHSTTGIILSDRVMAAGVYTVELLVNGKRYAGKIVRSY